MSVKIFVKDKRAAALEWIKEMIACDNGVNIITSKDTEDETITNCNGLKLAKAALTKEDFKS